MRILMKERAKLYVTVPGLCAKAFVLNVEWRENDGIYVWESFEVFE